MPLMSQNYRVCTVSNMAWYSVYNSIMGTNIKLFNHKYWKDETNKCMHNMEVYVWKEWRYDQSKFKSGNAF